MIGRSNSVSGGASFGHTIDFISEGANYARYMVTDGQSVATPTPAPTKEGWFFFGWKDEDENEITFPYTPSGDIELTAFFSTGREDMCLRYGGSLVATFKSGTSIYKSNDGWAIAGEGHKTHWPNDFYGAWLVAKTQEAAAESGGGQLPDGEGQITYKGVTYYYTARGGQGSYYATSSDAETLYRVDIGNGTIADIALTLVRRYLREI